MSLGTMVTTFLWSAGTGIIAAADPTPVTTDSGINLTGIALVISALAALVTAIGGIILGLRRSSGDEIDAELRRLLREKLREELDDEDKP